MKDEIRRIFSQNGIEMAQAISYSDVKETNGRLLSRLGFEPRSVIVFLLPYNIAVPLVLPLVYYFATSAYISAYAYYPVIEKYMITPYEDKSQDEGEDNSEEDLVSE